MVKVGKLPAEWRRAVTDLSFDMQAGELVVVMGPNGSGRLAPLSFMTGEYKPDSGTVRFNGRDIIGLRLHIICCLGIARTYQSPQPFISSSPLAWSC